MLKPYITFLLDAEKKSSVSLMWGRGSNDTIWISTIGYVHREHAELEKELLKLGLRYDFTKPLSEFCKENGRTETTFKERAA